MSASAVRRMSARQLTAVLTLFGLAYFLSLFFRSVNAVIAPYLSAEMGLDAASLGLLTAAYFLGLGLMQIPMGMFLDAYGPRPVQSALLLIAASGMTLFAISDDLWLLIVARTLIGVGLAGGLMAGFQVAALWLPANKMALANGCFLAVGGVGVLASTAPVEFAMAYISWRVLFGVIALATIVISLGIFWKTPDPARVAPTRLGEQIAGIRAVMSSRFFWCFAPLTAMCFATGTALQGLWAASWLRDVAGLDRPTTSLYLTAMALAMIVGSAGGGAASLVLKRFQLSLRHLVLGSAILFIVAQLCVILGPVSMALSFWLVFTLTYNVVTLSYALVAQSFPLAYAGRSNAVMNCFVILVTFVVQYAIGLSLEWWEGKSAETFSRASYRATFLWLSLLQILALFWCLAGLRRASG